jgi:hypothetical protein
MQLSQGRRRERRFSVIPLMPVRNLLPKNECCLQNHYLATGLYAAIVIKYKLNTFLNIYHYTQRSHHDLETGSTALTVFTYH